MMARVSRPASDVAKALSGWFVLAAVAGLYALSDRLDPAVVAEALAILKPLLIRVVPILVLVFGLLLLTNLFLEREWLIQHLGKTSGIGGWALAVVCGILSVGPLGVPPLKWSAWRVQMGPFSGGPENGRQTSEAGGNRLEATAS